MWFSSSYLIEITRWSKQNTFLLTSRYVLLWEVDLCSCRQELDPEDRELSKLKVGDFLAISQNAAEFTVQKLGTLRQADPALAVVSSGPRLHLDNRNFQCPDFRNWTNSLETGQKISTLLTLLRRLPSSPPSLRKDDEEDQRLRTYHHRAPPITMSRPLITATEKSLRGSSISAT